MKNSLGDLGLVTLLQGFYEDKIKEGRTMYIILSFLDKGWTLYAIDNAGYDPPRNYIFRLHIGGGGAD